jgi:hypothetical protein
MVMIRRRPMPIRIQKTTGLVSQRAPFGVYWVDSGIVPLSPKRLGSWLTPEIGWSPVQL